MDFIKFKKHCFIWTAVISAIVFLIIGLTHGTAVGYTVFEEIGLYTIMWIFVTTILEFFMAPFSKFLYVTFVEKKEKKD